MRIVDLGGFSNCVGMQGGLWRCILSAQYFFHYCLWKSVSAPKQSLCREDWRGAGLTHVVGGEKKKSGSDVGLIMLIPMNLYGNTSSAPSPHNLTSSRLQQKLATTTRESVHAQEWETDERLFRRKITRDLFVQLLHEVIRPPKRNAKMSVKISFFDYNYKANEPLPIWDFSFQSPSPEGG